MFDKGKELYIEDLKGHYNKHVEGIDEKDTRDEKIIQRESEQWKNHRKVTNTSQYKTIANKNIKDAKKKYIHVLKNGISVNFQKEEIQVENETVALSYSDTKFDGLLTTCVSNYGTDKAKIKTCFYKTVTDETLQFLNMALTINSSDYEIENISNQLQLYGFRLSCFQYDYKKIVNNLYHKHLYVPKHKKRLCQKAFLIELLQHCIDENKDNVSLWIKKIIGNWLDAYEDKKEFNLNECKLSKLKENLSGNLNHQQIFLKNGYNNFKDLFSISKEDYEKDKLIFKL